MAVRHGHFGHWCGYAGVPREHPAYGKPYNDIEVEFHGGLTYARACEGSICHVPQPGMPDDVWWLGGDFGHAWDLAPGLEAHERSLGMQPIRGFGPMDPVYRDLPYVRHEIERLAEQLAAMTAAA
jgi:hypothetical protein